MKRTYIWVDGEMVEKPSSVRRNHHYVIQDEIKPYKSMIDGRMISSRSEHRELLRRHNCVEVGNEKMETKIVAPKTNRREIISKQLGDMSDSQANKILKQLKKGI